MRQFLFEQHLQALAFDFNTSIRRINGPPGDPHRLVSHPKLAKQMSLLVKVGVLRMAGPHEGRGAQRGPAYANLQGGTGGRLRGGRPVRRRYGDCGASGLLRAQRTAVWRKRSRGDDDDRVRPNAMG